MPAMHALKLPSHSATQGLCPLQTPSLRHCRAPRAFGASNAGVRCRAAAECHAAEFERRSVLLGISAAALVALQQPAWADEESGAMQIFYGLAAPPTSYGGYGGNAKEAAKYTFEYPTGWKIDTIGKNEKGMQGIDSRVRNPRVKGQSAYVVTFGRAGEDNKKFKLGDVEQTLAGFAGADYDLQDALTESAEKRTSTREVDGQQFYDYDVIGPSTNYLASVTLKGGKVFALFVKSPTKTFTADEPKLRSVISSFKTV